jgi:uncharacterized protein with PhoU and TrkA domain
VNAGFILKVSFRCSIIAVVRGEKPIITQSPDFRLVPADTLVLVGTHAGMDKAHEYLSEFPRSGV